MDVRWIEIKVPSSFKAPLPISTSSPMHSSKSFTKKHPTKTPTASSSKRPRVSSVSEADVPKKRHKKKTAAEDMSEDEAPSSSPVRPHRKQTKAKTKPKKPQPKARVVAVEEVAEEDNQQVTEAEVIQVDEEDGAQDAAQDSVSFQLRM
jgi:hypothetical protein